MKKMLLLNIAVLLPAVAFGVIGTEGQTGGSDAYANEIESQSLQAIEKVSTQALDLTKADQVKKLAQDYAKQLSALSVDSRLKPAQQKTKEQAIANVTKSLLLEVNKQDGLIDVVKKRYGAIVDLTDKIGEKQQKTLSDLFGLKLLKGGMLDLQRKSLDLTRAQDQLKLLTPALKLAHAQVSLLGDDLSAIEITNIVLPSALTLINSKLLKLEGKKERPIAIQKVTKAIELETAGN